MNKVMLYAVIATICWMLSTTANACSIDYTLNEISNTEIVTVSESIFLGDLQKYTIGYIRHLPMKKSALLEFRLSKVFKGNFVPVKKILWNAGIGEVPETMAMDKIYVVATQKRHVKVDRLPEILGGVCGPAIVFLETSKNGQSLLNELKNSQLDR